MKKLLLPILLCATWIFSSCSSSTSKDPGITGLWKSRDQHSDKPRSLVAIYEYHGKYYGRMLATYDEDGKIKDTILEKKEKATGVVGHPPYCGMDFVYDVEEEDDTNKYKGKIVDPQKGDVYTAEIWLKSDGNLNLRGEVWIFGENITWPKASEKDLPKGFKMSEIKHFVPVIPKVT